MREAWRRLHQKELLYNFVMHGTLVLLGGGFLFFPIKIIAGKQLISIGDISVIGFFAAAFFLIMLLSIISLYRIAASHIRWHDKILDSIPAPVIITDKNGNWRQINEATRTIMKLEQGNALEKLNSKHLISENGSVLESIFTHDGVAYWITGNNLAYRDENEGFIILLNATDNVSLNGARYQLIAEINNILLRLSTATDHFHACSKSFAGCMARQAGIIQELSDVITGILTGKINEIDELNGKMDAVKVAIQQHMEDGHANMETISRAVKELDTVRNCIANLLQSMEGPLQFNVSD